jgi:hypothetical protein
MWFVTRSNGIVGVLDLATGAVQSMTLDEEIANGFAVDQNDIYIVSTKKMYHFTACKDNVPPWCCQQTMRTLATSRTGNTHPVRARP